MNAYDWLSNLPFEDPESVCRVVEISFNNGSRKDFYRNSSMQLLEKGDMVTVEGVGGFDVGMVSLTGEIVRLQLRKRGISEAGADMKKIMRKASERDLEIMEQNKAREKRGHHPLQGNCQTAKPGNENFGGGDTGRWKKSYVFLYCR